MTSIGDRDKILRRCLRTVHLLAAVLFSIQLLPADRYNLAAKNAIATYLNQGKIVCVSVDALMEYKVTMEEIYKFEGFCDALLDGEITNNEASLNSVQTLMEENCKLFLPFLDANGMSRPADVREHSKIQSFLIHADLNL